MKHRSLIVLTLVGSMTAATSANAQGTSKDALAESLFQEAKRLLDKGEVHAACEKFKASLDVDRASGTLTALAYCHQKEGLTASAWAEYQEVAAEAKKNGKADQEKFARDQIALLEPSLRRVTIRVTAPTPGLEVRIDGVLVPPGAIGSAIPVDPGERTLEAKASGYITWKSKIGDATTIEIPKLAVDPLAHRVDPRPSDEPQGTSTGRLVVGGSLLVVGAVAAGVGGYLQFVVARDQQDEARFLLREGYDQSGHDEKHSQALLSSTIGITGMTLGGIALLSGAYLVITAFPSKKVAVSPAANGVLVRGTF